MSCGWMLRWKRRVNENVSKEFAHQVIFWGEMFNIINKLGGFYSIARASSSTHAPPTKIDLPSEFMLSTFFPLFFSANIFMFTERKKNSFHQFMVHSSSRRRKERNIQFLGDEKQSPIEQAATSCGGKTECVVFLFGKMWEKLWRMEKFVKSVEKSVKIL